LAYGPIAKHTRNHIQMRHAPPLETAEVQGIPP
jgi:hypothetical protein